MSRRTTLSSKRLDKCSITKFIPFSYTRLYKPDPACEADFFSQGRKDATESLPTGASPASENGVQRRRKAAVPAQKESTAVSTARLRPQRRLSYVGLPLTLHSLAAGPHAREITEHQQPKRRLDQLHTERVQRAAAAAPPEAVHRPEQKRRIFIDQFSVSHQFFERHARVRFLLKPMTFLHQREHIVVAHAFPINRTAVFSSRFPFFRLHAPRLLSFFSFSIHHFRFLFQYLSLFLRKSLYFQPSFCTFRTTIQQLG